MPFDGQYETDHIHRLTTLAPTLGLNKLEYMEDRLETLCTYVRDNSSSLTNEFLDAALGYLDTEGQGLLSLQEQFYGKADRDVALSMAETEIALLHEKRSRSNAEEVLSEKGYVAHKGNYLGYDCETGEKISLEIEPIEEDFGDMVSRVWGSPKQFGVEYNLDDEVIANDAVLAVYNTHDFDSTVAQVWGTPITSESMIADLRAEMDDSFFDALYALPLNKESTKRQEYAPLRNDNKEFIELSRELSDIVNTTDFSNAMYAKQSGNEVEVQLGKMEYHEFANFKQSIESIVDTDEFEAAFNSLAQDKKQGTHSYASPSTLLVSEKKEEVQKKPVEQPSTEWADFVFELVAQFDQPPNTLGFSSAVYEAGLRQETKHTEVGDMNVPVRTVNVRPKRRSVESFEQLPTTVN